MFALVLTACTGRGGGYLPPQSPFTGQASFGFTFSCEHGDLKTELSYNEKGRNSNPLPNQISSAFGIHGIVDRVDPVLQSATCIAENPPPPPKGQLIFLGRYYLTSSAPAGFPSTCPTRETSSSPLCRFQVIVQDNDQSTTPSQGDFFSITLSTTTGTCTNLSCSQFPPGTVVYTRAGYLAGGNITVK